MADNLRDLAGDTGTCPGRIRESSLVRLLLIIVVVTVGVMETCLLWHTMPGAAPAGWGVHVAYLVEAAAYDLVFYASAGLAVLLLGRRLSPVQRCYAAAVGLLSVLAGIGLNRWILYCYFKNAFDLGAVWDLAEGRVAGVLAYLDATVALGAAAAVLYVVANVWIVRWLGRYGRSITRWSFGRRTALVLGAAWLLVGLNHAATARSESLRSALRSKCSFACIDSVLNWCGDVDGDGFGPLGPLPDPDNFDGDRHPYAVDVPGNGIDENGLAGDLAQLDPTARAVGLPRLSQTDGRNVMLIVVETMRFDLIGLTLDDREATPFLNSLAREQCYFTHAYSNYGMTTRAILTLLTGTLDYDDHTENLFDRFRGLGYRTCAVSAQNEEWGRCFERARMHALDDYFDARDAHLDGHELGGWQRLFPKALTVESRALNQRIFETIERDPHRPFFMYVNYQDLHYPYAHPSFDPVFIGEARRDSAFFREENRELILRQYANAAHYLDASFRELFDYLESKGILEKTVIVIVGDHGDSFYDDGVLGHGWLLSDYQTRVPLLLVNGRGEFTNPVGQDEVAGMLLRSVDPGVGTASAKVLDDGGKAVFLLSSDLTRPRQIGLRTLDGRVDFDFRSGRAHFDGDSNGQPADAPALGPARLGQFTRLVHGWESLRVLQAGGVARAVP